MDLNNLFNKTIFNGLKKAIKTKFNIDLNINYNDIEKIFNVFKRKQIQNEVIYNALCKLYIINYGEDSFRQMYKNAVKTIDKENNEILGFCLQIGLLLKQLKENNKLKGLIK